MSTTPFHGQYGALASWRRVRLQFVNPIHPRPRSLLDYPDQMRNFRNHSPNCTRVLKLTHGIQLAETQTLTTSF